MAQEERRIEGETREGRRRREEKRRCTTVAPPLLASNDRHRSDLYEETKLAKNRGERKTKPSFKL
ncbi:hypothetical protein U1Q18_035545, partial [Sarracenia purpurea var. burkii]